MIVLLVDPDARARRAVRTFLENRGVSVMEAQDLEEARAACARSHPSAIVAELLGAPDETVSGLRSLAPGVPILVWSAAAGREDPARHDGVDFLRKPALPAEVAFALGRVSPPRRAPSPGFARLPAPELRRWNRRRPAAG